LPDYSHVVLLLSGDIERDLPLLQRVAHACSGLPTAPTLLGIAANATAHTELIALARRSGLIYVGAQCNPQVEKRWWETLTPLLANWRQAVDSGWPVVPLRA
jgi:hypothetical protein